MTSDRSWIFKKISTDKPNVRMCKLEFWWCQPNFVAGRCDYLYVEARLLFFLKFCGMIEDDDLIEVVEPYLRGKKLVGQKRDKKAQNAQGTLLIIVFSCNAFKWYGSLVYRPRARQFFLPRGFFFYVFLFCSYIYIFYWINEEQVVL